VADQEIDDHQVHVELEVAAGTHSLGHLFQRDQGEAGDFSVGVARYEVGGQFQVVEEHGVGLQPQPSAHAIRQSPHRNGGGGQIGGNIGFFGGFLQQVLSQGKASGLAAGDHIVQLAGSNRLVQGAGADP